MPGNTLAISEKRVAHLRSARSDFIGVRECIHVTGVMMKVNTRKIWSKRAAATKG